MTQVIMGALYDGSNRERDATRGAMELCDGSLAEWAPLWEWHDCSCGRGGCEWGCSGGSWYDEAVPGFHVTGMKLVSRGDDADLFRCATCGAEWRDTASPCLRRVYSRDSLFEPCAAGESFFRDIQK